MRPGSHWLGRAGLGQFDLILFLGFLGLWTFEKGEWEKNWIWVSRHKLENICTVDVNRVLETRFTSGCHVKKKCHLGPDQNMKTDPQKLDL